MRIHLKITDSLDLNKTLTTKETSGRLFEQVVDLFVAISEGEQNRFLSYQLTDP